MHGAHGPPTGCSTAGSHITPSPGRGELYSVAAVSAGDVWAVGDNAFAPGVLEPGDHQLVAHWDGTRWRSVTVGLDLHVPTRLTGVAAVSAHDVWAVGEIRRSTQPAWQMTRAHWVPMQTLIAHWDGARWHIVTSPNGSTTDDNVL